MGKADKSVAALAVKKSAFLPIDSKKRWRAEQPVVDAIPTILSEKDLNGAQLVGTNNDLARKNYMSNRAKNSDF